MEWQQIFLADLLCFHIAHLHEFKYKFDSVEQKIFYYVAKISSILNRQIAGIPQQRQLYNFSKRIQTL
jgi:hypothetical protein